MEIRIFPAPKTGFYLTSSVLRQLRLRQPPLRRPWGYCPCRGSPSFPRTLHQQVECWNTRGHVRTRNPDFLHIRKHIRSKKSLVLWLQRHYITWFVHETIGFWIKVHLGTTFLHLRASLNIFHHPEATLNIFHHLCIIPAWKIHPGKFKHSAVMW